MESSRCGTSHPKLFSWDMLNVRESESLLEDSQATKVFSKAIEQDHKARSIGGPQNKAGLIAFHQMLKSSGSGGPLELN